MLKLSRIRVLFRRKRNRVVYLKKCLVWVNRWGLAINHQQEGELIVGYIFLRILLDHSRIRKYLWGTNWHRHIILRMRVRTTQSWVALICFLSRMSWRRRYWMRSRGCIFYFRKIMRSYKKRRGRKLTNR